MAIYYIDISDTDIEIEILNYFCNTGDCIICCLLLTVYWYTCISIQYIHINKLIQSPVFLHVLEVCSPWRPCMLCSLFKNILTLWAMVVFGVKRFFFASLCGGIVFFSPLFLVSYKHKMFFSRDYLLTRLVYIYFFKFGKSFLNTECNIHVYTPPAGVNANTCIGNEHKT